MSDEDRSEDGIWSIECPECGRRDLLRLGCCCLFFPYVVSFWTVG